MLSARSGFPIRLAGFGCSIAVLYALMHELIRSQGSSVGVENGVFELMQVALALVASVCFFVAARRGGTGMAALAVCGAMMAYAAARESDSWFESVFFDDAYKWLVGVPAVLVCVGAVWRHRDDFREDTLRWLNQPPATVFVIAGIYLAFVCQMLDRPGVWQDLSVASDSSTVKPVIEEAMEVFAYAAIAYSSVESILFSGVARVAASVWEEPTESSGVGVGESRERAA